MAILADDATWYWSYGGTKRSPDSFALTPGPYNEDVNSLRWYFCAPPMIILLPLLVPSTAMHKPIGGQTIVQTHPHAHGVPEIRIWSV